MKAPGFVTRRLAAIALSLAGAMPAAAGVAFMNDVTDLWWNENESGWGVNIIQQSNIAFATFFVYDTTGQPHWYVASDMVGGPAPAGSPNVFTGQLFETSGPVFSAASFNPSSVTVRAVGRATFEFTPPNSGTLDYTVDGVPVTKRVTRQTWAANNFTGTFSGGRFTQLASSGTSGCTVKTGLQMFDSITVTHSGSSFTMTAVLGGGPPDELCTYTGTYTQAGHMGNVEGAFSCNGGANGSFSLRRVEIGTNGFMAAYDAVDRGCSVTGNFSAVRSN